MSKIADTIKKVVEDHRKTLLCIMMGIVSLVLVSFFFRSPIASWYLHRKAGQFNREHQADLKFDGVRILGLASLRITGLSLKPETGDTLMTVDTAYASIGILKLFAGRISIHDVLLVNARISLIRADSSRSNWQFLLRRTDDTSGLVRAGDTLQTGSGIKRSTDTLQTRSGTAHKFDSLPAGSSQVPANYAQMAERMFDLAFDKIPLNLEMKNFQLRFRDEEHEVSVTIGRFDLHDHFFRTVMKVREDSRSTDWVLAGLVDNHKRRAEFRIYRYGVDSTVLQNTGPTPKRIAANQESSSVRKGTDTTTPHSTPSQEISSDLKDNEKPLSPVTMKKGQNDKSQSPSAGGISSGDRPTSSGVTVPYLRYKWNTGISFDTLAFGIRSEVAENGRMELTGFASIKGFVIDHWRIASTPIFFERLSIDYRFLIGKDHIELDSSTRVSFNNVEFDPYAFYQPFPSKRIVLRVHKPWFPARDLFSSFPVGLFKNLDGLEVRGKLAWNFDLDVALDRPDSLLFSTSLDRLQFGIVKFGATDLTRLNDSFLYTAYEKGEPVRSFIVGPENPDFRALERISPFLRAAVMTSEDGGFYQHRGFLPDAFRESIITNIKERRFARGGSTISMQLIKNVFLSRNKTIARKLEEALLVWLIENQGLSHKDRMFEVYLNIIEWGPMIYGAQEASRFYFNKDVSKLTISEAIFMASIIPRPKSFRWSFDDSGHLRESNAGFYRLVSEKMLSKGWITTSDAARAIPDVELKGPARLLLKSAAYIPADTLETDQE